MLRPQDLQMDSQGSCYLRHPSRSEELDDTLLDAANQIDLDKKDLRKWVLSSKSADFLDTFSGLEIESIDFLTELKMACDDGIISVPRYRRSHGQDKDA